MRYPSRYFGQRIDIYDGTDKLIAKMYPPYHVEGGYSNDDREKLADTNEKINLLIETLAEMG